MTFGCVALVDSILDTIQKCQQNCFQLGNNNTILPLMALSEAMAHHLIDTKPPRKWLLVKLEFASKDIEDNMFEMSFALSSIIGFCALALFYADVEIYRKIWITTIVADNLTPCVARLSAAMVSIIQSKHLFFAHEDRMSTPWAIAVTRNYIKLIYIMFFLNKFSTSSVNTLRPSEPSSGQLWFN